MDIYNVGLDGLADWGSATYMWVLLGSVSVDRTHDTVADVLGDATEITASGYARAAVTTAVRTVDDIAHRINYTCDDADFGALDAGETVVAVLLYRMVTNDADSIPIGLQAITPTATDEFDPFRIDITDGVIAYLDQAA